MVRELFAGVAQEYTSMGVDEARHELDAMTRDRDALFFGAGDPQAEELALSVYLWRRALTRCRAMGISPIGEADDVEIAAYHEAGHAVVGTMVPAVVVSVSVCASCVPKLYDGCQTRLAGAVGCTRMRDDPRAALAGLVAESLRFGWPIGCMGALGDVRAAIASAKAITGSTGDCWRTYLIHALDDVFEVLRGTWESVAALASRMLEGGTVWHDELSQMAPPPA